MPLTGVTMKIRGETCSFWSSVPKLLQPPEVWGCSESGLSWQETANCSFLLTSLLGFCFLISVCCFRVLFGVGGLGFGRFRIRGQPLQTLPFSKHWLGGLV